jgi:antitoxin component YwqK of YwqJK toxin-antitoxin module
MKNLTPIILSALAAITATTFSPAPAAAQNEIKIEEVDATNLGDGRILFRNDKDETPLNGRHRLIDGVRSEYIEAVFTDGFFDGSYEHYRNKALVEKGTFKGGVQHGLFTEYYPDGKIESETPFTDGEVNGMAKTYYPDGTLKSEANVTKDKIDGIKKDYYSDGTLEKEKGYKDGKDHGPERAWEHGSEKPYRDHNYADGVPDGRQYSEIDSNAGDYIEIAHFDKGKPTGEFLQTWAPSGDVKIRGSYGPAGKQGVWVEIRKDGKMMSEEEWKEGKRNGESKTFFTDNSVEKITTYKDDKREGVEKTFRFDGGRIASEYNYTADTKEGDYKIYYDDEKPTLREEGRIRRGTEVWRKEYYPDGKVKRVQERPAAGGTWTTLESYD